MEMGAGDSIRAADWAWGGAWARVVGTSDCKGQRIIAAIDEQAGGIQRIFDAQGLILISNLEVQIQYSSAARASIAWACHPLPD